MWTAALNLRAEWPTLTFGALAAYQFGFLMGAGAVWAGAWLGLRDRVSGAADLVTVTPTAPWRLWRARQASVAVVAAGAFALLSAATLAVLAAAGGRGMPDPRLLADGALALVLSGLIGLAVGRLSGSRLVALLAGPVWFVVCMVAADPWGHRLSPVLVQIGPQSAEFGFVPDPLWPHLGYLLGLVLLVGGLLTLAARGSGQRPQLAPVLAVMVAGLVLVGAGATRLVAIPESLVMLGPDRADWKPVAEAEVVLADPSFAYPDDGRATACAGDATLTTCVYPAYRTALAQRVNEDVQPVARLLTGLPGVPTRTRMVPMTIGHCHGSEVQVRGGDPAAAPGPRGQLAGPYLSCVLGRAQEPGRSQSSAGDVRDAVRLWALLAGGVVTRQELQRAGDSDLWLLGVGGERPSAMVAPALAMFDLPPDQVRAELAPVWERLRAGTLPLSELPGQRP